MKRNSFIRELVNKGCYLKYHSEKHDVYLNPQNGRRVSFPRHAEIKESLCELIKIQLGFS